MMYSLINKSSVFITYCFIDGSVSIGDVCIHLRKPVSPELVPVKYGEFLYFENQQIQRKCGSYVMVDKSQQVKYLK